MILLDPWAKPLKYTCSLCCKSAANLGWNMIVANQGLIESSYPSAQEEEAAGNERAEQIWYSAVLYRCSRSYCGTLWLCLLNTPHYSGSWNIQRSVQLSDMIHVIAMVVNNQKYHKTSTSVYQDRLHLCWRDNQMFSSLRSFQPL